MSDVLNQRKEDALDRLDSILAQHSQYINGGDTEFMVTELGIQVPTLAHQARLAAEAELDINQFISDTADHLDSQVTDESGV